jgi:hypothetical protein
MVSATWRGNGRARRWNSPSAASSRDRRQLARQKARHLPGKVTPLPLTKGARLT